MNSLAFVAAFALIACTSASAILPTTRIVEGPSSRTTLLGPDGSVIDTVNPGSKVITHDAPAIVAGTAAVVPAPLAYSASGLHTPLVSAYSTPYAPAYPTPYVSAYSGPYVSAYSAPHVSAYSAPHVSAYSGPYVSAYHAPALSAYTGPVVSAYSTPVVSAYSAPVVAGGVVSQKDTLVAGPSGSIATSKTVATPGVVAHHGLYV